MAAVTPSTPPALVTGAGRLRTPDAPIHGAQFDEGPWSPRRSRRTTTNRYSSSSARNAAIQTPPQSSPPSPPSSPSEHRTPEKRAKNRPAHRLGTQGVMTPTKTPRQNLTPPPSRVRRPGFQFADPSHAMPTPRKMKKHPRNVEVYGRGAAVEEVEVYSDWNARVPTRDESDANPFLGPPTPATVVRQRQRKVMPRPLPSIMSMTKAEMKQRVDNDEGLIFTFRGKQVFRPYSDSAEIVEEAEKLGYKPIARSTDRPRRLNFGRRQEIEETDEEALTDIEVDTEDVTPISSQTKSSSQAKSPFADWPRTKAGSRKREIEDSSSAAAKKVRSDL